MYATKSCDFTTLMSITVIVPWASRTMSTIKLFGTTTQLFDVFLETNNLQKLTRLINKALYWILNVTHPTRNVAFSALDIRQLTYLCICLAQTTFYIRWCNCSGCKPSVLLVVVTNVGTIYVSCLGLVMDWGCIMQVYVSWFGTLHSYHVNMYL